MSLKKKFIETRDNYVINRVKKAPIPKFKSFEIRRYRLIFSGRVQK